MKQSNLGWQNFPQENVAEVVITIQSRKTTVR